MLCCAVLQVILGKEQERLNEEVQIQQDAVDRMAFVLEAVSRAQVRATAWATAGAMLHDMHAVICPGI